MNRYTLGTILGTALLGFSKSRKGSNVKKKLIFDSAIHIIGYFHWEASFAVDEEISEQQSSEQQSSEQQSDWNSSSEFDREEMLDNIEGDIQAMQSDFESGLGDLISDLEDYTLHIYIESNDGEDEDYEVEIGFYLVRERDGIDTWINVNKVEEEFMEVFEMVATQGEDIVSRIIEGIAIEGATLNYVARGADLEISENSSRVYIYSVDKNGKKTNVKQHPRGKNPNPKLRKR